MSDTLRTDTLLIIHDMDPEPKVLINHARALERALNNADARIKRLEEQLMEVKNKHSALVADVVLDEDRAERIKRLEEAGDRMRLYCADPDDCFAWDRAKETKP